MMIFDTDLFRINLLISVSELPLRLGMPLMLVVSFHFATLVHCYLKLSFQLIYDQKFFNVLN